MADLSVPTESPLVARFALDRESRDWLRALEASGAERDAGIARLHGRLLRVAYSEVYRRRRDLGVSGPELDDLAHQAAGDALVSVLGKVGQFRGESRFTTWAFRFVIFEVATKVSRHFWREPATAIADEDWDRLPDRFGFDPARRAEWHDLISALRHAVEHDLTDHQRRVFVALVLRDVPLDVLVAELGSSRNALYKAMFDARRKLRLSLAANGYVDLEMEVSA
jgi:RNA polymerase sigma-70 factor (ECF subfamily)